MGQEKKGNCCNRISNAIISTFESLFQRIGSFVGGFPVICVVASIMVAIGFGIGISLLKQENRREKLWVPAGSDNQEYLAYITENYKDPFFETMFFENDNILSPGSLKEMLRIDEKVKDINVGKSWNELCFRLGSSCYVSSILELWGFNRSVIETLTQEDILKKINEPNPISLVTFKELDVRVFLGGVDTSNETYITSAVASVASYALIDNSEFDDGLGRQIDKDAEDWELEFIELITDDYEDINVYGIAYTSFNIESGNSITGDTLFLVGGYALLLVYVIFMLSKCSRIEHKIYIALSGILTVGLAVAVSIGLGSILGLIYTPVHSILPFLLLGIGVDDMFVIVQCWLNLSEEEKAKPVKEQCAFALKHAGVSITVTSITDFSAFVIGATTILPALRSFCIYCGIGILFLFLFSIFFFTATLCLDYRRVKGRRDACCCCIRLPEDYEPSECSERNIYQKFFDDVYAPFLTKTPVKIVVVIVTLGFLGVGVWGLVELEQFFDFRWFLPADSYATEFVDFSGKYYPQTGLPSSIYLNDINLFEERSAINSLYEDAKENKYVDPKSFSNWYEEFGKWIRDNKMGDQGYDNSTNWPDSQETFNTWLQEFLDDPFGGATFTADIIFNGDSMDVKSSRIAFAHVTLYGSVEEVKAMDSMQSLVDGFEFEDGYAFAFSDFYLDYETNKVIQEELLRNMGLACACVFVIILLLLADIVACLLVFLSVFLTLIDLAGFAHHWDLTIDTVVTIQLILSIGIAVDYAAHIGHTFMTVTGSRNERARKAITDIGPAVFNGGFSTFLAFILLSLSSSYIFKTFFKIFLLVVVFGMFHGIVLLPVLLSWIGPAPYASAVVTSDDKLIVANGTSKSKEDSKKNDTNANGNVVDSKSQKDGGQFNNPAYNDDVTLPKPDHAAQKV